MRATTISLAHHLEPTRHLERIRLKYHQGSITLRKVKEFSGVYRDALVLVTDGNLALLSDQALGTSLFLFFRYFRLLLFRYADDLRVQVELSREQLVLLSFEKSIRYKISTGIYQWKQNF